jgi:predicted component of type VI protein secretion system
MQVLLRVNTAHKPEKKIKVSRDVLIGRERGRCDLRVASSEVSRRHCQILVGEKTVDVRDLGSANGTRVNGERIPAKTNFPVNPGDLVEIGPLEIRVEFRGAKKRPQPVAKPDDDFLSQDNALAALDEPGADMEHSAPEILIENRLIDSGDDYGSSLETVDAAELGEGRPASESESFDDDSSENLTPQELSPLEADEVLDLEPLEPLEVLDEEAGLPVQDLNPPALEPAAADPVPVETPGTPSAESQTGAEDSKTDDGAGKKGRLKSLFGRIGRKKETVESPSETAPADEAAVAIPAPAEESPPNVEALPVAEFPVTSSEPDAPSVDLAVPAGGEVWEPPEGEWEEGDEELVSVEDLGPLHDDLDEVEEFVEDEEEEDSPPADEGFADFLNDLDEPK